ncbi:hypothetical protein L7F22_043389 [Adiantum nelumboides]|nr:hypothetical protein [Adiantum nelumboides]
MQRLPTTFSTPWLLWRWISVQSMAGHAPGNQFYTPGTVFGGAQTMMPNPMYGGIGIQLGFQSTQSQFGMPQANFGMAGITNQQPTMASPGFDDRKKALSFLQQFDKAYAGGNFTEASKVRKAATYLTGNVGQWWTTLLLQGQAPSTWIYVKQTFASAWLSDDFEADVMTEWHQLNAATCKNLDDFNRKFWKSLLLVTSYRFVPLTEQIEKYSCGLPKGLRKYCMKTKVTTLMQLIEVANTGNGLLKGEDCEFNTGVKEGSAKKNSAKKYVLKEVPKATQEPAKAWKGKATAEPAKGPAKKWKRPFPCKSEEQREVLRSENKCFICEQPGHIASNCPQKKRPADSEHKEDRKGKRPMARTRYGAKANFISPELASKLGIRPKEIGIMDAYNKKITVQSWGKTHILHVKLKGESIPTVSASAITSVMKKHLSAYLVFAREVTNCDESNLSQYSDWFYDSLPSQLPPERPEDHAIDSVPSSSPPNRPPYGKKDGSWHMCIDYRALNKNTIKNMFPIPRIDDILDKLGAAAMFSRIDLKSGYHQIHIRSEDVHKTALRTTFGLYEFLVMPFGLTNAPPTFNRMMDRIFRPHRQFVGTFFDDMILYSKNEEEHRHHLAIVFKELRSHRLLINAKKSEFFLERFTFWDTLSQRMVSEWILLRSYVGDVPEDMPAEDQPEVEELDEILVPEQILAHKERKVKGKVARRYLVYPPMDAEWMEEGKFAESPTVLSLYLEACGLQPTLTP